jgi:hypothetical protein
VTIVTLLSDFGSASPYPAQVKAVLHGTPRVVVVDITHDVPPRDVAHGAYLLRAAAPAFPAGTVHLAVVDPGVGSARAALAITAGGQCLVGPDNGLLTPAARRLGRLRAHVIDVETFGRRPVSTTFHGRDVFAPVAAVLAGGLPLEAVGPPAPPPVELPETPAERAPGVLRGQVLYCDRFGNVITNIPGAWLNDILDPLAVAHPRGRTALRRVLTYAAGTGREVLVLVGSDGTLELAVNGGSAADALGIRSAELVTIVSGAGTPPGAGTLRE